MNKWTVRILVLILLLSGCSKTESKDGKTTLKFLSVFSTQDPEGDLERKIIADYLAENPNIAIETTGISMNNLAPQVVTRATGRDFPDIIFANMNMAPRFNDLGILAQNLKELVGQDFLANFSDFAVEVSSIDDHLMYLPLYSNPIAVIYRKDLFDEKGLKPPKTLEEFLSVARDLTEDTDGDGKIDRWGMAYIGTRNSSGAYRAVPIMRAFGAFPVLEVNGEWQTKLGGKESAEALAFIRKFIVEDASVPPGVLETGYAEAVNLFSVGKAAMIFTGSSSYGALFDQNPEFEDKLASFAFPYDLGYPPVELAATGYAISESSEHKQEAADFLKFYYSYDNMLYFATNTGRMPTRIDVSKSEFFSGPLYDGFLEAAQNSVLPPLFPGKDEIRDAVIGAVHRVIGSNDSIEEINSQLKEQAMEALANS